MQSSLKRHGPRGNDLMSSPYYTIILGIPQSSCWCWEQRGGRELTLPMNHNGLCFPDKHCIRDTELLARMHGRDIMGSEQIQWGFPHSSGSLVFMSCVSITDALRRMRTFMWIVLFILVFTFYDFFKFMFFFLLKNFFQRSRDVSLWDGLPSTR